MKKNNVSSFMDEEKKKIIKNSEYSFRDALETAAFMIETGEFEEHYNMMKFKEFEAKIKKADE
jgi:hypothetical protein